ncbi:MAG: 23S rRNA (guanosine(2251)-2'-O)-methyltransferase RlmB [Desulfobacteraceae bacterium]|nr:MAG: 23S rRNA (guanosine(2251)-2'-O)-methyltransferase RlmB [Desulfobacteraceae bacterium]
MPQAKTDQRRGGSEILFGVHSVRESIRAGRRKIFEVYALGSKGSRNRELIDQALSKGIPVKSMEIERLQAAVQSNRHQGIGALVGPYPFSELSQVLSGFPGKIAPPFLLLLDSVVDPQNLGALARTALCAGVDGIFIPKDRSASPTPAVSRASAGALEHARLVRITNLTATITDLKKKGLWIIGLDAGSSQSIFSTDLTVPLSLVIGGEEKGIRPLVKKNCDLVVSIPQSGVIGSLNAAAAGAVAMYEVYRQRAESSKLKAES